MHVGILISIFYAHQADQCVFTIQDRRNQVVNDAFRLLNIDGLTDSYAVHQPSSRFLSLADQTFGPYEFRFERCIIFAPRAAREDFELGLEFSGDFLLSRRVIDVQPLGGINIYVVDLVL